eukprot:scaffold954_cov182-Cylindrotheca_fusiformis.AAC.1
MFGSQLSLQAFEGLECLRRDGVFAEGQPGLQFFEEVFPFLICILSQLSEKGLCLAKSPPQRLDRAWECIGKTRFDFGGLECLGYIDLVRLGQWGRLFETGLFGQDVGTERGGRRLKSR